MKNVFICVFILFIFPVFLTGQENNEFGKLFVSNYQANIYDAHAQNWSIVQDHRGIMYFANGDGVLEFDGVNWNLIELPGKTLVRSLAISSTGQIFVGSLSEFGYLSPSPDGNMQYQSLSSKISGDENNNFQDIWHIHINDNEVYFFSFERIFRYKDDSISVWGTSTLFSLPLIVYDRIFVKQRDLGLFELKNDALILISKDGKLDNFNPRFYQEIDSISALYASINKGLFKFTLKDTKDAETKVSIKPLYPDWNPEIYENNVYSGVLEPDNTILGTFDNGVYFLTGDNTIAHHLNKRNGLNDNSVLFTFLDHSGDVWFGLNNGIGFCHYKAPIVYWDESSGLEGMVLKIMEYHDKLFIGTYSDLYYIENEQIHRIPENDYAFGSMLNFQGKLMIGGNQNLYEYHNGKLDPVASYSCYALHTSKVDPNRVFVGVRDGLVSMRFENNKWIDEGKIPGLSFNIRSIFEENDSTLWLSSFTNGIIKISHHQNLHSPENIQLYDLNSGLQSLKNLMIHPYDQDFKVGSETGLFRYYPEQDKFIPDSTFGPEFCSGQTDVFNLQEGSDGKIWITGLKHEPGNIVYGTLHNEHFDKVTKPFNIIPKMMIFAFHVDKNGTAWIGGSDGLFRFQERKFEISDTFPTLIRKVTIDEDSVLFHGTFFEELDGKKILTVQQNQSSIPTIKHHDQMIRFDYAAISYVNPSENRYQYFLEGYSKSWSSWSDQTYKEFLNLPGGRYTFTVRSKNIYDEISSLTSYHFRVLRPWYASIYAILSYIIFLGLLVWLLIYWYTIRLRRANIRLEKIVMDRTADIITQKEEIEAQAEELTLLNERISKQNKALNNSLDELKKTQEQLVHSEKMASLGLMAAGIGHEINNPLNFIKGGVNTLLDHLETSDKKSAEEIKPFRKIILEGIKRASAIVKSLSHFSRQNAAMDEECNIHNIIDNCLVILQNKIKHKINLIKEYDENEPVILGNEGKLHQVFINLLSNAEEAIEKKGTIKIITKVEKKQVIVSIIDDGTGIDKKHISKISDPFFTTKEPGKGIGLGLSISYAIMEEHKGKIKFSSNKNEGTTVFLKFPKNEMDG